MLTQTKRFLLSMKCADFIGAPGHHAYFSENEAARARILQFRERIRESVVDFMDEEYPVGGEKSFIVNMADGKPCLVDGNAHLVALITVMPDLTLENLIIALGRNDFVRLWENGWEDESGQFEPYDVYAPVGIDTTRIPGARVDTDWFKQPPAPTKVVPANVPYDSLRFSSHDRGLPLGETARCIIGFLLA